MDQKLSIQLIKTYSLYLKGKNGNSFKVHWCHFVKLIKRHWESVLNISKKKTEMARVINKHKITRFMSNYLGIFFLSHIDPQWILIIVKI